MRGDNKRSLSFRGNLSEEGAETSSEWRMQKCLGLVDEYRLFVRPVLVGGGTPFFPPLDAPQALELVETRTFGSKVVYLRYAAT